MYVRTYYVHTANTPKAKAKLNIEKQEQFLNKKQII